VDISLKFVSRYVRLLLLQALFGIDYRVVNTWNTLLANIVSATSLAMFKARLNDLDLSEFAVLF